MKIGEGIEEFVLYMRLSRFSEHTQKQYRWHINKLTAYLEEHGIEDLAEVSRRTLRAWSADAAERWAPSTHRQAICAVKGFFRFLYEDEILESNPAKSMILPKVPKRIQRTLDTQELAKLLRTAKGFKSPRRERETALISLLTDSGLRAAEVCRLPMANIDLRAGLLIVIGKGNKEAVAPFGEATTQHLKAWFKVRRTWLAERDLPDPGTVFISVGGITRGRPLTPDGLRRVFAYLGRDAGVPKLSPHVFRRTFATLMLENGASSRITQLAGRWSKISMVEVYSRSLQQREKLPGLYRPYSPIDGLQE
jgi:site-specific recombinase XerD